MYAAEAEADHEWQKYDVLSVCVAVSLTLGICVIFKTFHWETKTNNKLYLLSTLSLNSSVQQSAIGEAHCCTALTFSKSFQRKEWPFAFYSTKASSVHGTQRCFSDTTMEYK